METSNVMTTAFTPLTSLLGGVLIGTSAAGLLLISGRIAGITGLLRRLLPGPAGAQRSDALAFVAGVIAAPLVWTGITGQPIPVSMTDNVPLLAVAGFLTGFGSVIGNGCTSGHGVCGLSRLSGRSLLATGTFMAVAMLTVFIVRHVLGGP